MNTHRSTLQRHPKYIKQISCSFRTKCQLGSFDLNDHMKRKQIGPCKHQFRSCLNIIKMVSFSRFCYFPPPNGAPCHQHNINIHRNYISIPQNCVSLPSNHFVYIKIIEHNLVRRTYIRTLHNLLKIYCITKRNFDI